MKCAEATALLARYADGELGGLRGWTIGRHLRACASCAAQYEDTLALRKRLRAELPYYRAPPQLHARLRALASSTQSAAPGRARARREHWRWLAGGALAGCSATIVALLVGNALMSWRTEQDTAVQVVAMHTGATQGDRLIEVASSDQHTVKPWLSQRLDYSPPVQDLTGEGFPLIGARLSTLQGRSVATLVYRHRQHTIDVFVAPAPAHWPTTPQTLRGFHLAHATGSGMDWLAVSDVNADELAAFVQRLARAGAPQ